MQRFRQQQQLDTCACAQPSYRLPNLVMFCWHEKKRVTRLQPSSQVREQLLRELFRFSGFWQQGHPPDTTARVSHRLKCRNTFAVLPGSHAQQDSNSRSCSRTPLP